MDHREWYDLHHDWDRTCSGGRDADPGDDLICRDNHRRWDHDCDDWTRRRHRGDKDYRNRNGGKDKGGWGFFPDHT